MGLPEELKSVYDIYYRNLFPADMDYMRFCDISEKLDSIEFKEELRKNRELGNGEEVAGFDFYESQENVSITAEELDFYETCIDRIHEEAKQRIGGQFAQYDQVIRGSRLCKLFSLEAPQVVLDNESKLLAEAMAVRSYAVDMREEAL